MRNLLQRRLSSRSSVQEHGPSEIQGKITKLDKATHQLTLQRGAPGETVGTAGAATEQFLLKHDPSFDVLKVGDQVTLKVEDVNGVREITHYDK